MGSHPINLIIRFLLEMTALISFAIWAWKQGEGNIRYLFAIALPILLASIWGIFAVPDDPSRSGSAPIATPGLIRLFIELAFFVFAAWTQYDIGNKKVALVLAVLVMLHYLASYDRIKWLLS